MRAGGIAAFYCAAQADPLPVIQWKKNGKKVSSKWNFALKLLVPHEKSWKFIQQSNCEENLWPDVENVKISWAAKPLMKLIYEKSKNSIIFNNCFKGLLEYVLFFKYFHKNKLLVESGEHTGQRLHEYQSIQFWWSSAVTIRH